MSRATPDADSAQTDSTATAGLAPENPATPTIAEMPSEPSNPAQESHLFAEMIQIRQGVAVDRVISAHDEDMRHGRKSASKRFDGHKLSVCVDTCSKLILSVDVIADNAPYSGIVASRESRH